jgi:transglutaminase-like putative cysteine protease
MTARRHMGLVAALATLLAAAPLTTVFEMWTWFIQCLIAVTFVAAAATLARSVRGPLWAQLLAMMAALLLALTWMFPSGRELFAILPSTGTLEHFGALANEAVNDMRQYAVPVPDSDGLLFVTVLGIGAVAILVDFVAVGLRRPALAGLPMLAIYSVPVAVYAESVPFLPFIAGALGFLWLLVADKIDNVRRFGRRFTGDGRDVDVWEPSPLAAAGRRLAAVGVALAVLLPVAVPGMTTGLLDRFNSGVGEGAGLGQGTGRPGRVNLFAALQGQLRQTERTEMVRVRTDDPSPFYLKFAVADQVLEDGVRGRNPRGQPVQTLPAPPQDPPAGVTHERFRAEVEITDKFEMQVAPIYGQPTDVDGLDNGWNYDPNMQVVYSGRQSAREKEYRLEFVRTSYTPQALADAPALLPQSQEVNTFTRVTQVPEVTNLVNRLTAGETGTYEKVLALYRHFSVENGFSYDLQTEGGTSGQDIVDFLENKKGYCQQYAAALTWLVRAAGIPARVAFGFTNGSQADGDTRIITNLDLHAWTEVYFGPQYGWVPFDATPRVGVPNSARTVWAPDVDATEAPAASASASASPGASGGPEGELLPDERDGSEELPGAGDAGGTAGPSWPLYVLGGAIVLLALLATPALRRVLVRRRRQVATASAAAAASASAASAGSPDGAPPGVPTVLVTGAEAQRVRADAHAAWDELIDTLVDYRVPIDRTETPRATAERLAADELGGHSGPAVDAARLLGRAEERARYAREPMAGTGLTGALRAVRRALAERATRRTRLVAALLPPSVLGRWRAALVDTSMAGIAGMGRFRDLMVRWSPRRLLTARAGR